MPFHFNYRFIACANRFTHFHITETNRKKMLTAMVVPHLMEISLNENYNKKIQMTDEIFKITFNERLRFESELQFECTE